MRTTLRFSTFLTTCMLSGILFTNAQKLNSLQISAGVNAGIPSVSPFSYTLGADVRVQKNFGRRVTGTLTAGFTHFFEKDHFEGYLQYGSPYNVIPVKAGAELFLSGNFYVGAEAGAGFAFEQWGNSFLWSPSIGVALKSGVNVSIKYEDYTKSAATKNIALRISYGIQTNKSAIPRKRDLVKGWRLGVNINPGVTVAGFSDLVLGGAVSAYKRLTNNLEASLSGGAIHYFRVYPLYYFRTDERNMPGVTIDYTTREAIPVKAGLRLYAGNLFYAGGEAGAAFATHGGTSFMFAPSAGLNFNNNTDIGIEYDNYSNYHIPDQVTLRLGYRFN